MHSSHLLYLVFITKTCLLKHTFLLPNIWKICDYYRDFYIWALNSMNTQVISLMITDDFSSNPKLSSLTLILTVSTLSFFMQAKNYSEMCQLWLRDWFNHLLCFSILKMYKKKQKFSLKITITTTSGREWVAGRTAAPDVKWIKWQQRYQMYSSDLPKECHPDKEIGSLKLNDYIEMNKHHFQYSNLDLQLNSTMLFLFSK